MRTTNPATLPAPTVPSRVYTLEEQQAALNLSRLAQGGPDRVGQLIQVLLVSDNALFMILNTQVSLLMNQQSEASPSAKSVIANLDTERIVSGNLSTADITTLQTLLAQADALRKGITTVLEYRTKSSLDASTNVGPAPTLNEQKALTPESTSADDTKLDTAKSPHSSPKPSRVDIATDTLEESAMDVD